MQLISDNWQDINKYYCDSYVKFPNEYGDKLFYVYKVRPDGILFKDDKGEEGILNLANDVPYDLNFILPHKTMFQKGQYCYLLQRIPAKQYHRGITSENCAFHYLSGGVWRQSDFSWSLLNAYTNKPLFRSITEVVQNPKGFDSEALSRRFAIGGPKLFCDTINIGRVDAKKSIVYVLDLFKLEVEGLLDRTGAAATFKVETYK